MSGVKTGLIIAATLTLAIVAFCAFAAAVERAADNSAAVALANGRAAIDYAAARQLDAGTAAIVADTAAAHDKTRQVATAGVIVALCVALFVVTVAAAVAIYDNQRRQVAELTATVAELRATMTRQSELSRFLSDNGRQGNDNVEDK